MSRSRAPRARSSPRPASPIDLLVNNASLLGPSPQPALAEYPLDALRQRLRGQRARARSRSSSSRSRDSRRARPILNITSDAAVEPYEGWGGYGSSKAALEQLTAILAVEQSALRVYAVDPGDMNTQMHQEAFPGEDISDRPPPEESVPGLLALIEGSLPSGRYRAREPGRGAGMSAALAQLAPPAEATEPPESRGLGRDDVAMLVATRGDGRLVHARFPDLPRVPATPATCSSSTPRPRCRPRSPRGSAGGPVELRLSTPARRRRAGSSSCARAAGSPSPRPPVGARLELPGGAHAELLAPYAGGERLCVARLELSGEPLEAYLAPPRPADPLRLRARRPWPLEAYQTVFAREPGSAEMPSAGRPFTAELVTRAGDAAASLVAPADAAHRRLLARAGRAPRTPSATASRPRPPRLVERRPRLGRARRSPSARPSSARWRPSRRPTAPSAPGEGWTSLVVTPERGLRAVDGLLTGWHEPESSHLQHARGGRRAASCSRAPTTRPRARGYRWHEFGDVHLILP